MIYLLSGAIIGVAAVIIVAAYCWFVYSAMLKDISHYEMQQNRTVKSETDL